VDLGLAFLYVGGMGLKAAFWARGAVARAGCFLALTGVANVPIVHYEVTGWKTLHQGETIRLIGPSKMDPSMMWPLILTVIGTKAWFVGSLLQRARALNLEQESGKDWARAASAAKGTPR